MHLRVFEVFEVSEVFEAVRILVTISPAFADKSEGGEPFLRGAAAPPDPPAGLRSVGKSNFDFSKNTFFSNFKLWRDFAPWEKTTR